MEEPTTKEVEHHGDTRWRKSSVEAMMMMEGILDEREV